MTRKKISNREELLSYKVGVRFDEKTFNKLKAWVQQTNASSVGELVRKIVTKEPVTFYTKDCTMEEPTNELVKIRKELNAIGVNINQITNSYHTAEITQKVFHALKIAEQYNEVSKKINLIWKLVTDMQRKWSAK